MKIKIPGKEIHWVSNKDNEGNITQVITSNQNMTKYYLYNVNSDGSLNKIETKETPIFKNDILARK